MTRPPVDAIESASALRRGFTVWFAVFGGVGAWTVHLVYLASAEHWAHTHHQWVWTLNACTAITAGATAVALLMAWRLLKVAKGSDTSSYDDAGQLLFLAQVGLLVGAINLALILLEGAYVLLLPHS